MDRKIDAIIYEVNNAVIDLHPHFHFGLTVDESWQMWCDVAVRKC